MEKYIDRIASYHLFNYAFPGSLIVLCFLYLSNYSYAEYNIIVLFALSYFCGLFASRIGSLLFEPLLKKIGFIKFVEMRDFVCASKNDAKIETLMETANMYRSIIVVSLIIVALSLIVSFNFLIVTTGAISFVIFLFSYRKQIKYIVTRIEGFKNAKK